MIKSNTKHQHHGTPQDARIVELEDLLKKEEEKSSIYQKMNERSLEKCMQLEGVINVISNEVSKLYTSIGGAKIDLQELDKVARLKGRRMRSHGENK